MKPIKFVGKSLDNLKWFPVEARQQAGYQLHKVQSGEDPDDWKPMKTVGTGVKEIRIKEGEQYRVIYIAKLEDAVYVLHAFKKKTQKTSQHDIEIAKQALKQIQP
ncbi:type II toxin-antitoxin system RelE/ParE family toxin [Endozoicomonas sp. SM1973]|uniref:Type II toxin-antitoxin system RelE/ParE family toxin n=1 Tax=Spartinivicinus marinus TaxID=2994442 RepID=A0A853I903_9GAMM|nr:MULTISPECIES: type II toxin-antitoxin system RelE/ParE family toxin [Spartinivicinus]NYZ69339.1 type II toxin-antitoxin system RelE/ParE family toxin [Spartinivicinus marinus]